VEFVQSDLDRVVSDRNSDPQAVRIADVLTRHRAVFGRQDREDRSALIFNGAAALAAVRSGLCHMEQRSRAPSAETQSLVRLGWIAATSRIAAISANLRQFAVNLPQNIPLRQN
jgi:hypothetical protein